MSKITINRILNDLNSREFLIGGVPVQIRAIDAMHLCGRDSIIVFFKYDHPHMGQRFRDQWEVSKDMFYLEMQELYREFEWVCDRFAEMVEAWEEQYMVGFEEMEI